MMTVTITRTGEFTITDARYVGAKIGADLRLLNNLYGRPALALIDDFTEEAALLLRDGYLATVDYGFCESGTSAWKLRLRYTATIGGQLIDNRPGSLPSALSVARYDFHSYLTYSTAFRLLTPTQQAAVRGRLPISRSVGDEPTAWGGYHTTGHGYSRNGVGVTRDVYTAS
jgi:Bacterial HORMA domain family 1